VPELIAASKLGLVLVVFLISAASVRAASVPLIHDFYDVDPTVAAIKASGRRSEI
jgi:hypothetical protein